jgi:hypothetical protein
MQSTAYCLIFWSSHTTLHSDRRWVRKGPEVGCTTHIVLLQGVTATSTQLSAAQQQVVVASLQAEVIRRRTLVRLTIILLTACGCTAAAGPALDAVQC